MACVSRGRHTLYFARHEDHADASVYQVEVSLGLILPDFSTFFALNERVSYSFGVRRLLTGATSSRPPAPPSRPVLRKSKKPHSFSSVLLATTFLGLENFLPTARRKINERASARQLTSCVFGPDGLAFNTHTQHRTRACGALAPSDGVCFS